MPIASACQLEVLLSDAHRFCRPGHFDDGLSFFTPVSKDRPLATAMTQGTTVTPIQTVVDRELDRLASRDNVYPMPSRSWTFLVRVGNVVHNAMFLSSGGGEDAILFLPTEAPPHVGPSSCMKLPCMCLLQSRFLLTSILPHLLAYFYPTSIYFYCWTSIHHCGHRPSPRLVISRFACYSSNRGSSEGELAAWGRRPKPFGTDSIFKYLSYTLNRGVPATTWSLNRPGTYPPHSERSATALPSSGQPQPR